MVYLIHFNQAYRHARHYVGSTDDLAGRLDAHRSGQGARLLQVVTDAGIGFECVRTWNGGRKLERQIKSRKEAPRLCPICAGAIAMQRCK